MKGYTTHETFWADTKMYANMYIRAFLAGVIAQFLIIMIAFHGLGSEFKNIYIHGTNLKMPGMVAFKYITGIDIRKLGGQTITVEPELQRYVHNYQELPKEEYRQFADWLTGGAYKAIQSRIVLYFWLSFLGYLVTGIYLVFFILTSKRIVDKKFLRGMKIIPSEKFNKKLNKRAQQNPLSCLHIGDTILPYEMETKHCLILGTVGSGKSVLVNQFAAQLSDRKFKRQTNDRCIFYDLKGEFIAKQYNSKLDLIFSPFDARSVGWNIFNEIEIPPDQDVIAKSLYLSTDTKDEYWYNCAKDVFRTILVYLRRAHKTTNRDLWEMCSLPLEQLQDKFKELPLIENGALKHIDKADSPAAASIISILQERIQFLRYMIDMDSDFSFRKFIRNQATTVNGKFKPHPNLFILNIEQYKTIFKPMMTLALDTMIRETLSLSDDLNRRIFFIIDELGTLYRMDSMIELETAGRSKGACLICANQDLGRIEEAYGKANLKSLFNNFNTTFTFRIREPETAEYVSKSIGEQEVVEKMQSTQMSPSDVGDRRGYSDQKKMERLIIPSELQEQEDLHAVINIANFGISRIEVPRVFYKERHPGFVMREFLEPKNDVGVSLANSDMLSQPGNIVPAAPERNEDLSNHHKGHGKLSVMFNTTEGQEDQIRGEKNALNK